MSGITLTEVANATIPTPASGKVTVYMSVEEAGPAFKDDAAAVTSLIGATGSTGATGAAGPAGGAVSIPYVFSTTTTDSDPGSGNLRLSNATQTSATVIRADLLASDTTDWSAVLATLADSTNTLKGHIRLFKTSDPTKWLVFSVSSLASPSGYKNITVTNVAGSTASPFANSDAITFEFTRAGDVGSSGTAQVATDPIWDAAGDLAVGTGADTAARLAKGADRTVLQMASGAVGWAEMPGRLLAVHEYAVSVDYDTSSATFADVDATNMAVTFTAPASGNVIVRLTACATIVSGTNNFLYWGLREATTNLAGGGTVVRQPAALQVCSMAIYLTGVSAGSHTYKWSFAASANTGRIGVGVGASDNTSAIMEVWAAP